MLNLASLSALLRTLRQAGDGAAGPVERIAHVRRPASEGETQLPTQTAWRDRMRGVPVPPSLQDDMPVPRRAADRAAAHIALREAPGGTARGMSGLAAHTEEADGPSASLALTRGGALVAAALSMQASSAPLRAHVDAAQPLVAHERTPAPELAGALARSVADSGLFYEAHLARWSREAYPAAALAREPQAQWPVPAAAVPAGPDGTPPAKLPDGAVALLTRQLDALDARQVVWSGHVWPGQPATIAFDEAVEPARDDAADDGDGDAPRAWRTRIALDLPSLGRVEATIALDGTALHVRLAAAQDDSVVRLQAARAELASALAPSRLALAAFVVDQDAPASGGPGGSAAAFAVSTGPRA